jgi:hypothetical protein
VAVTYSFSVPKSAYFWLKFCSSGCAGHDHRSYDRLESGLCVLLGTAMYTNCERSCRNRRLARHCGGLEVYILVHERCSIRNLLPQKNCYISDAGAYACEACRPQTLIGCLVCEIKWPIIISLFSLVFCLICGKNKLIHHHPIPHKANKIVHYEE